MRRPAQRRKTTTAKSLSQIASDPKRSASSMVGKNAGSRWWEICFYVYTCDMYSTDNHRARLCVTIAVSLSILSRALGTSIEGNLPSSFPCQWPIPPPGPQFRGGISKRERKATHGIPRLKGRNGLFSHSSASIIPGEIRHVIITLKTKQIGKHTSKGDGKRRKGKTCSLLTGLKWPTIPKHTALHGNSVCPPTTLPTYLFP
jgi:hypothetical protein